MLQNMKTYFMLCLFLGYACAWPWREEIAKKLTMEGVKDMSADNLQNEIRSSQFPGYRSSAHAAQDSDVNQVQNLCSSVVSQPHSTTVTPDTVVNVCLNSAGVPCYFSALERCCATIESNIELGEAKSLQLGSQEVTIRYFYSGGFGSGDPLRVCALIPDDVKICANTFQCDPPPERCEDSGMCLDKALQPPEVNCDPVTGCQCQTGHLRPDCCECDINGVQHQGRLFYESGDECPELCLQNCLIPGPPGAGCFQCRQTGFQEPGCCTCVAGFVMSNGICCPDGQAESNGMCCPVGQTESNGICCPVGQTESNGVCCSAGQTGSNGICCPIGQAESNGICCPIGLSESNGICCSSGEEESNGMCCQIGLTETNGVCCSEGQLGSNGICCDAGESESNGICCPTGQTESNGRCCPSGETESNGICCPTGESESNGVCCLPGQVGSNGRCCPIGQAESNGRCCPIGQTESNGVCCSSGQFGSNGICCPNGQSESNGICCPPGQFGSNGICCPTGESESNGICCPSGQSESNGRCCPSGETESNGICCPIGERESNGICCPSGQLSSNGICTSVCHLNCEGNYSPFTGCSVCEEAYASPPFCCGCATGFVEDADGKDCIPTIPCGENQDIIFILDITQSFEVRKLRQFIRALQLIFGAVDNNAVGLRVAVVHYPYLFSGRFSPPDEDSNFIVSPNADCDQAVKEFETLSLELNLKQSEGTNVTQALEFVAKNIDPVKATTVITVTSDISDGYSTASKYPPNTIRAAINSMKSSTRPVRFFVIGDSTNVDKDDLANFEKELEALSDGNPRQRLMSQNGDSTATLINQTLTLLENGSILCSDQAGEIRKLLAQKDSQGTLELGRYATCIENINKAYPRPNPIPPCYTSDTCPSSQVQQLDPLESEILRAVEQVLMGRANYKHWWN